MPTPESARVIEIIGEGKTDIGKGHDRPEPLTRGVVPILVRRLCQEPEAMQVRRRPMTHLQGKSLWQKVAFAKRQAFYNGSAGMVFVRSGDLKTSGLDAHSASLRSPTRSPNGSGPSSTIHPLNPSSKSALGWRRR